MTIEALIRAEYQPHRGSDYEGRAELAREADLFDRGAVMEPMWSAPAGYENMFSLPRPPKPKKVRAPRPQPTPVQPVVMVPVDLTRYSREVIIAATESAERWLRAWENVTPPRKASESKARLVFYQELKRLS